MKYELVTAEEFHVVETISNIFLMGSILISIFKTQTSMNFLKRFYIKGLFLFMKITVKALTEINAVYVLMKAFMLIVITYYY